jgi:hypothetical protein
MNEARRFGVHGKKAKRLVAANFASERSEDG